MRFSKRLSQIPTYIFAKIDKLKESLVSKGENIIDLGVGDPDFPTPKHIIEALQKAVEDPKSHGYPPYEGIPEFKQAVADWYKTRFNVDLDPKNEVISLIGSKEGIAHIFLAFLDNDDYALIPDPCYPVFRIAPLFAGGIAYPVPLLEENKFLPDLENIDKKVLKRSKMLFLNYPNNPTGAIASKGFYEYAVNFALENDLLICSDLAYSEVAFNGYKPASILEIPDAKKTAIEFHSLSKTYSITGFRIGMAVGNAEAVKALSQIKTNIDSGIYKAIQYAGVTALTSSQEKTVEYSQIFEKRRDIMVEGLRELGWPITPPKATFYIWAKIPKIFKKSADFTMYLLEKTGVLVVPGSGYGKYGEGYFRISLTSPESLLQEAIERIKKAGIYFG
jgi:LL-diaminopimelate aminotransferase